ncbi:DNA repair protein RadC [Ferrovum sp.]|uniref:RadC family protein n=1 Tax=Ferrovum sp. TaxID=2609467 RepID=UPI0026058661|nr:DNA repair protein RadC [Ferrovum sp.]
MTPVQHWTNAQLLACLFGTRGNYRACEETLEPLFSEMDGKLQRKGQALREVLRRWLEERLRRGEVMGQPAVVKDYLRLIFKGQAHESFWVLYLDAQHQLIQAEELFRGTLTQTAVYPREVLKGALRHNAAAILLSHNHPSGLAQPSTADRQLTEVLKRALTLVDIRVLDHFVVAGPELVSFAEQGWL